MQVEKFKMKKKKNKDISEYGRVIVNPKEGSIYI